MGNKLTVDVGMEEKEVQLLPSNFLTKLRLATTGSYITVKRISIKIIPLVSRNAGVSGKLYLRDITDSTGRKLHCTQLLDLGREVRLSMRHIDFAFAAKQDIPIVFGFEELASPFLEGRALFSVSLRWHFGLSANSYSLPSSIMTVQYQDDALKRIEQLRRKPQKATSQQTLAA